MHSPPIVSSHFPPTEEKELIDGVSDKTLKPKEVINESALPRTPGPS